MKLEFTKRVTAVEFNFTKDELNLLSDAIDLMENTRYALEKESSGELDELAERIDNATDLISELIENEQEVNYY